MKAKELIKILEQHPNSDVIFWDGDDNWDVEEAEIDSFNGVDMVLVNRGLLNYK